MLAIEHSGVSCYLKAQDTAFSYPFIQKEFNHLNFSTDSSSFLNFFNKLEQLKQGKEQCISIVHMGGSHVQGGVWSNKFISKWQTAFNSAGGGYFGFPYKIAKTNGQPYMTSFTSGNWKRCRAVGKEFCLPLGMSALSIITNDSSNYFGVKTTKKATCRFFNRVKVFHNFNSNFDVAMVENDSTFLAGEEHREFGYTLFRLDTLRDSVSFLLTRSDTLQKDFALYGFSVENDQSPGFYLAALGANGASSSSFLRCEFLLPQLESLNADLFILSLGVNDTQSKSFEKEDYIENYDTLITYIKKSNPHAAIILTTTTDNYIKRRTSNKRTITAREAMFELMEKHQVAVWDLFSLMGGYKSMPKWLKVGLASPDKVHFTNKGYELLGDLMYEAVLKAYSNNIPKN
ncbi:MAG: GDSL-type esterase/lipase family protein [bacterium]|nr:GDSL-type esterase/lipase family protein [bacterium]